jgi:heme/copper-type cytochrome/quinol oxidase subunit 2
LKTSLTGKVTLPSFSLDRKLAVFPLSILILASLFGYSFSFPHASAAPVGNVMNFYVVVKPDFAGQGYDVFSPKTLVVQQGDQVNLTISNTGDQAFHLIIQGEPAVTIQPGSESATGVTPVDTAVPVFTASTPGIFNFYTTEHPEMSGQLIVLPSNWANYSPTAQTRSFTQIALPDFAGDGYDKYFPAIMVVNQGDTVNVTVRNTDDMPHGFAIAAYGIDAAVNPGQDLPGGSIAPTDTVIQPFTASTPGIFSFLCTVYCGPGHSEMVGCLVVLPTRGSTYNPQPATMYSYLTIKPDFAGNGYDQCLPGVVFANVNDLVYIKVRNTDTATYEFTLPNFDINNESIAPATVSTTGGLTPTDTYLTAFSPSQSGIFEFSTSNFSGTGNDQMIGYLVVLPTQNTTTPTASAVPTTFAPTSIFIYAALSAALLIVGILIGIVIVSRFSREELPEAPPR